MAAAVWVNRSDVDTVDGHVRLGVTDDKGNDYEFVMLVEQAAALGVALQGVAQINEEEVRVRADCDCGYDYAPAISEHDPSCASWGFRDEEDGA